MATIAPRRTGAEELVARLWRGERPTVTAALRLVADADLADLQRLAALVALRSRSTRPAPTPAARTRPAQVPAAPLRLVVVGTAEALCPTYGFRRDVAADLAWRPSVAEWLRHPTAAPAAFDLLAGYREGLPLTIFTDAVRAVRDHSPAARIAGFSADDLWYWSVVERRTPESVARDLLAAGLDLLGGTMAVPGPDAPPFADWLAAHVAAHRAGLPSEAAPRFDDCPDDRATAARLLALRDAQTAAGPFVALCPVALRSGDPARLRALCSGDPARLRALCQIIAGPRRNASPVSGCNDHQPSRPALQSHHP